MGLLKCVAVKFRFMTEKPDGVWAIGSREIAFWVIAQTVKYKEIICFVWLYFN